MYKTFENTNGIITYRAKNAKEAEVLSPEDRYPSEQTPLNTMTTTRLFWGDKHLNIKYPRLSAAHARAEVPIIGGPELFDHLSDPRAYCYWCG